MTNAQEDAPDAIAERDAAQREEEERNGLPFALFWESFVEPGCHAMSHVLCLADFSFFVYREPRAVPGRFFFFRISCASSGSECRLGMNGKTPWVYRAFCTRYYASSK